MTHSECVAAARMEMTSEPGREQLFPSPNIFVRC